MSCLSLCCKLAVSFPFGRLKWARRPVDCKATCLVGGNRVNRKSHLLEQLRHHILANHYLEFTGGHQVHVSSVVTKYYTCTLSLPHDDHGSLSNFYLWWWRHQPQLYVRRGQQQSLQIQSIVSRVLLADAWDGTTIPHTKQKLTWVTETCVSMQTDDEAECFTVILPERKQDERKHGNKRINSSSFVSLHVCCSFLLWLVLSSWIRACETIKQVTNVIHNCHPKTTNSSHSSELPLHRCAASTDAHCSSHSQQNNACFSLLISFVKAVLSSFAPLPLTNSGAVNTTKEWETTLPSTSGGGTHISWLCIPGFSISENRCDSVSHASAHYAISTKL